MKTFLRFLLRLLFRYRAVNAEVLATKGPVLLVPNHVSWIDWLFLGVLLDDDWRFVTSSTTAEVSFIHKAMMVNRHTFAIDPTSPYAAKRMAELLKSGGKLVLFAEGRISQTGSLMKVFDGVGFLIFKTRAKVITCHLKGAHRLPFSSNADRKVCFPQVTALFSDALTPPHPGELGSAAARRFLTDWLRDRLVEQVFEASQRFGPKTLPEAVNRMARIMPEKVVLEDATNQSLTYRRLTLGADLLGGALRRRLKSGVEPVGVLLPNVNATPALLFALWSVGKVPAMLNFSTGAAMMVSCLKLAGITQVVTSKKFLERGRIASQPFLEAGIELIHLEEVREGIPAATKMAGLIRHRLRPGLEEGGVSPDSTAAILFTSGSEGVPKGVELSHRNILANIHQMLAVTDLADNDRVFNCLPMFHSFGLTVGTLLPLVRGMYAFVYPSPLHYRMVPVIFYDKFCTVFLSTNTFLNGYARKAHPYDFRSMRYLFAAAEKLQEATAEVWASKFGVRILEGYGATECAPCVAVNTPLEPRHGTVGKRLPGIEIRLEPVEGVEEGGRLHVRGPNVMKGYLNKDAHAEFAAKGGWYDTGDIVSIDGEGYFRVLGRLKRFAKVSGEMVSLTAVEDALAGAFPHYGIRCQVAVVSQPDPDKGERLIAATNEPKLTLEEIRNAIKAKGLGNLCVPRAIQVVKEIPKLGTGKINHRELRRLLETTP